ncbi:hypothetical protein NLM33_18065 [Bradyrhizobium sp. CCGUVB1N3]|uniref:hypothetical protein n=1 Tax=Bradyrhizobium sp. CCGUVB1N3 TaxID=2949629 RepID=UPI0020B30804|nr:hypothetical protein [Bradyrhizobium sp. CCGUVB1N3]MCP3472224.1 hypothetical protein [Bradyrhizobium sp. CCGUVB1N3]
MIEMVWGFLVFLVRAVNVALDIAIFIADTKYLARLATGADKLVKVPPAPQPLPGAAQRALTEAEERERLGRQANLAASGTVQASLP